jgi:hypothetical protein
MSAFRREVVEGNMDRDGADVLAAVRGSRHAAGSP